MLKKTLSSDSWEFPWNSKKTRPTRVPQSQSGRNVGCTSFLMCFVSVLLLTCGLILLGLSIWSLIRKIPYSYLIDIKVDIPYFTIPASCLCFPCFWISMSIHNNSKKYEFLHLLTVLLVISIALLVTGSSLGFIFLSKTNSNTIASSVTTSLNTHNLNASLQITILEIEVNTNYATGWAQMQQQLHCCGIKNYRDWLNMNRSIPGSCCKNIPCTVNNVFKDGCLDSLSRDLSWHLNVFSFHCYMVAAIQVMAIILAVTVYFTQKRRYISE